MLGDPSHTRLNNFRIPDLFGCDGLDSELDATS